MILDAESRFDNAAALTADRASTNIIDLVNARDLGDSYVDNPNLKVRVQVVTALVSGGASTLVVQFQGSTDNVAWDTYISTPAIPKASLVANAVIDIPWPVKALGAANPRYVRLNYDVTTDFTGGTISAFVVLDRQANIAYPAGINVSN